MGLVAARARKRARLGTKIVLVAGFGGVLGLMVAAGIDSVRALHLIETQNANITRQYLKRHHSLDGVRSSLYLSNAFVRDYLLGVTSNDAQVARARLEALRQDTLASIRTYSESSGPEEAKLVSDLSNQVVEYWAQLGPVFKWTSEQQHRQGYRFLEEQVFPRRALLLAIADRVGAVNEQALRDGDARSAEAFRNSRRRVIGMLSLTLSVGALFAAVSGVYILRLERESSVRFHEVQSLSTRLVEAQEQERRSISRELHDEVGQTLNALLVDLGNLAAVTPTANQESHQLIRTAKGLADQSVKALRNMALLLRPSMLDDFGLVPALHWQAREVSRRTGMRIDVEADEVADGLPEEHSTCVYRVVQEALQNSSRHAGAKTIQIRIHRKGECLLVSVQDDGKGFQTGHVRGLGLIGMEERVKHLNGRFQVTSREGEGTLLRVELPLPILQAQTRGAGA